MMPGTGPEPFISDINIASPMMMNAPARPWDNLIKRSCVEVAMAGSVGPYTAQRGRIMDGQGPGPFRKVLTVSFLAYLLLLACLSFFGKDWYAFTFLHGAWFLSYLVLFYLLAGSSLIKGLDRLEPWKAMLLLASVSILLQLPFLLGSPSMSQDILRMERRGEMFIDGSFPYRDFTVNKPPLYIWMVGLLSLPFGPDERMFRAFFVLVNALVPVVMYAVHKASVRPSESKVWGPFGTSIPFVTWAGAAVAYSLCPIVILETALAGHYDPVVVISTLVAFLCLIKDRPYMTGFFLGLGFALKLYPMFIAPLFFFAFRAWKLRVVLFLGFFTVPVAATLPVLLVDPALVPVYLKYQFVNWYTGYSLRYALEWLFGTLSVPLKEAYYIVTSILGLGTIYYVLRGLLGKPVRSDAAPLVLSMFILASMGVGLSSLFLSAGADSMVDLALGGIGIILTISSTVLGLHIYLHGMDRVRPLLQGMSIGKLLTGTIPKKDVPFLASCILLLVILTSAQFHPWYLSWVLPFALASGVPQWGLTVLLFFSALQSNSYPPWEM